MKWYTLLVIIITLINYSCEEIHQTQQSNNGKDGWLKGDNSEKFDLIASQLRGFDMAMIETGYRYQELYWAGQDQNWEYAMYQIEKIAKTIKNGLVRRPKRGESAKHFLEVTLTEMTLSIEKKDTILFNNQFNLLTNACNNCHIKENVSFFTVKGPINRPSPIRK